MKFKTIHIIRHGETDYNKNGLIQGQGVDTSINEKGRQQSDAFFKAFKNRPIDKIYLSALRRTKESVAQFLAEGIPYEILSGLNEIGWGDQEGKKFNKETAVAYYSVLDQWKNGNLDERLLRGEYTNEVMQRQRVAMTHIMANHAESEILICMHGRAMRILLAWLLGHALNTMDEFDHTNLGRYQLSYRSDKFIIDMRNDVDHLKDLFI